MSADTETAPACGPNKTIKTMRSITCLEETWCFPGFNDIKDLPFFWSTLDVCCPTLAVAKKYLKLTINRS